MEKIPEDAHESSISVAIAAWNGEKFIREQLDSISFQSIKPVEIVVSDDCSGDRTLNIVDSFAETYESRIVVIRNRSNSGILINFYRAFEKCVGDYIAYCDQDDVWDPKKLEEFSLELQRARGSSRSVSLYIHSSNITDSNLKCIGKVAPVKQGGRVNTSPSFVHGFSGLGHQMIFSRKLLPAIKYLLSSNHGRFSTCYDWMIPLVAGVFGDVVLSSSPLTNFRRHPGVTSDAGGILEPESWDQRFSRIRADLEKMSQELTGIVSDKNFMDVLESIEYSKGREYFYYLKKMIDFINMRHSIYAGNFQKKISMIGALLLSGGYRSRADTGHLGWKAFVQDAARTALFR